MVPGYYGVPFENPHRHRVFHEKSLITVLQSLYRYLCNHRKQDTADHPKKEWKGPVNNVFNRTRDVYFHFYSPDIIPTDGYTHNTAHLAH